MIHAQVDGICFDLDNSNLGTWDALEMMADMQDGEPLAAVRFARLLFGEKQLAEIKKQLPDNSIATMAAFINNAIKAAAETVGEEPKN